MDYRPLSHGLDFTSPIFPNYSFLTSANSSSGALLTSDSSGLNINTNPTPSKKEKRKSVTFDESSKQVRKFHLDEVVNRIHIRPKDPSDPHTFIAFWGLPGLKKGHQTASEPSESRNRNANYKNNNVSNSYNSTRGITSNSMHNNNSSLTSSISPMFEEFRFFSPPSHSNSVTSNNSSFPSNSTNNYTIGANRDGYNSIESNNNNSNNRPTLKYALREMGLPKNSQKLMGIIIIKEQLNHFSSSDGLLHFSFSNTDSAESNRSTFIKSKIPDTIPILFSLDDWRSFSVLAAIREDLDDSNTAMLISPTSPTCNNRTKKHTYRFEMSLAQGDLFVTEIERQINEIMCKNQDLFAKQAVIWEGCAKFKVEEGNLNWSFAIHVSKVRPPTTFSFLSMSSTNNNGVVTDKQLLNMADTGYKLNEPVLDISPKSSEQSSKAVSMDNLATFADEALILQEVTCKLSERVIIDDVELALQSSEEPTSNNDEMHSITILSVQPNSIDLLESSVPEITKTDIPSPSIEVSSSQAEHPKNFKEDDDVPCLTQSPTTPLTPFMPLARRSSFISSSLMSPIGGSIGISNINKTNNVSSGGTSNTSNGNSSDITNVMTDADAKKQMEDKKRDEILASYSTSLRTSSFYMSMYSY